MEIKSNQSKYISVNSVFVKPQLSSQHWMYDANIITWYIEMTEPKKPKALKSAPHFGPSEFLEKGSKMTL